MRPCIQCRTPLVYPAQPGEATCPACGVRQYLTEPSAAWPTGGVGRDWDGGVPGRLRRRFTNKRCRCPLESDPQRTMTWSARTDWTTRAITCWRHPQPVGCQ